MVQEEFLSIFSQALAGQVTESRIQENVNYYRRYINDQIGQGKTESEVLESLGNPRLLAKTIIERDKFVAGDRDDIYTNDSTGQSERSNDESTFVFNNRIVRLPSWLIGILAVIIIALVIGLVFSLLSVFAPVILAVVVGVMLYRIVVNVLNR